MVQIIVPLYARMYVWDDALILPLCASVCECLSAFVSVSLCACVTGSSQA